MIVVYGWLILLHHSADFSLTGTWMPFPDIENCFPRLVHIRPADIGRRVDDGTPESRLASLKWTNDLTSDDIAWVVAQLRNVLPSAQGFSDVSLVLHEESQSFGFWDQYGYIVPLRKAGSGVIQIIYTLLRIALARRRISNAGTDSRNLLLAIDEPEQHLASGLQKAYARLLKLFSADHQIIVTSHSHLFLERGVDGATVVLQRGHRNGTVARPQRGFDSAAVRSTLGVTADDSLYVGEVNVIVEGPSEAIALPRLVDSLRTLQRTTVRPDQIMMIPRHGASKVPPFAHLVAEMGLGLVILLDNDLEGRTAKDKISQTPALSSTPVLMIPLVTSAIAAEFEDLFPEDLLIEATAEYITHRNWELTVTDFHDLYIREPAAVNQKWSERLKKVLSFKHYLAPGQNVKDVVDKAVVMAKVVDRLSPNAIPSFVAQDFLSAVQNVLHTRSTAPVPGATERQNPPARATTLLHEANFTDTLEHDV